MNEQKHTEFTLDNTARGVYHKVKSLGKFIKRGKARYYEKCTIIAVPGKVIIRIQGTEFYIPSNPTNKLIIEVYYTDLREALENDRSTDLKCIVQDRTLIINDRKLSCEVKKFKKGEFEVEAGLGALNFGEVNPTIPSWQKETFKLKSTGEEIHVDSIRKDAEKAALILKRYKVDSNKIMHLIMDSVT